MILEEDSPKHALLDCAVEACLPRVGETWNYSWRMTPLLILKVNRQHGFILYDDPDSKRSDGFTATHFTFDYWFELLGNGVIALEPETWRQRRLPPQLR